MRLSKKDNDLVLIATVISSLILMTIFFSAALILVEVFSEYISKLIKYTLLILLTLSGIPTMIIVAPIFTSSIIKLRKLQSDDENSMFDSYDEWIRKGSNR